MRLLAIDPGTICMGLALFDGPELKLGQSLEASEKWMAEQRIAYLMEHLTGWGRWFGADAAAIERPGAAEPSHRSPELMVLCRSIRRTARSSWRIPLTEYATGTITAAVALRGWPGDRKAKLRAGVCALYGEKYRDAPQDVIDSIAVGHTYLCKLREQELGVSE